jgi:dihydrofolate reductase
MSNPNQGAGHRAETTAPERIGMIWAEAADGVIGANGSMPWSLPEDLAHCKATTNGHPVIMGRKTWESFPEKFRPLPGRTNIVITRDAARHEALRSAGAVPVATAEEALKAARAAEGAQEIWVIGGGEIYSMFAGRAHLAVKTVINASPKGDTTAPALENGWSKSLSEPDAGWLTAANGTQYRVEAWEQKS